VFGIKGGEGSVKQKNKKTKHKKNLGAQKKKGTVRKKQNFLIITINRLF